jgi:hypothetical protein
MPANTERRLLKQFAELDEHVAGQLAADIVGAHG